MNHAQPTRLNTAPNLACPDDVYEAIISAHEGLDEASSHKMNAMLVLILANHIGDAAVIGAALDKARSTVLASRS
jgi:hypothetical protein